MAKVIQIIMIPFCGKSSALWHCHLLLH